MNKENLLIEKERILKNIKRRESRIKEIDKLVEELETKKWKPSLKEAYYYIGMVGSIYCTQYTDNDYDKSLISIGNYFKTEEEAEFELERLKVLEELKEFTYDFSEEEWKNNDLRKYCIIYRHNTDGIDIDYWCNSNYVTLQFKTEEDCEKAKEKIGEERLKKYYFRVDR